MKTEIINAIEIPDKLLVHKVLPLADNCFAVLFSQLGSGPGSPTNWIVQIFGEGERMIRIADFIPPVSNGDVKNIFRYQDGFGLSDHAHSLILLWSKLDVAPMRIEVKQSPASPIKMLRRCLGNVSYSKADHALLIGINHNGGPTEIDRYWTTFKLPKWIKRRNMEFEWSEPQQLEPENYPMTHKDRISALEWLSIMSLSHAAGKKYIHTNGGMMTRTKTGPRYEFNIVSIMDNQDRLIGETHFEDGKITFTADQKHIILLGNNGKRLFIYDIDSQDLSYEIALTPKQNSKNIKHSVYTSSELFGDTLYVYTPRAINMCRLLRD